MDSFYTHPTAVLDKGAVVGAGTKIWHFCHLQSGAVVGKNCTLGQNVYVGSGAVIGNGVKVQNNVSVYSGVILEDGVFCGPSCVFTNDLTPRAPFPKGEYLPTRVQKGASLGANAVIVCGCTVGRWAMVGAGAVVTQNVPDHALMAGVPARRRGWVCQCGAKLKECLTCPECGREYRRLESGLAPKEESEWSFGD